ncbi:hypothetical protein NDU88_007056 [Pleurodeles waltl]|uniref:Uncharacterized protein n=1 Tax=Pleurodeles waltl TaxID=8319 RepID=A0AAV7VRE7_PLEWA|nr:hypothetical protein NDU88_007056 [Pleurodeles waltl]
MVRFPSSSLHKGGCTPAPAAAPKQSALLSEFSRHALGSDLARHVPAQPPPGPVSVHAPTVALPSQRPPDPIGPQAGMAVPRLRLPRGLTPPFRLQDFSARSRYGSPPLLGRPPAPVPRRTASQLQSPAPAVGTGRKFGSPPARLSPKQQGSNRALRLPARSPQVLTAVRASIAPG